MTAGAALWLGDLVGHARSAAGKAGFLRHRISGGRTVGLFGACRQHASALFDWLSGIHPIRWMLIITRGRLVHDMTFVLIMQNAVLIMIIAGAAFALA
ncbi:MAG: hypothetical protein HIU92_13085 [Proteobacteria bacterium]|nr:hypothetical protein [Pseudomonadota bacterium]